jgi:hypothetical protein
MFLEKDMQLILGKGQPCSWKRTCMPLEKGQVQLKCISSFERKKVAAASLLGG